MNGPRTGARRPHSDGAARDAYVKLQQVLGGLLCLVGVALVAATVAAGGGPAALGFLVGVAIAALGAARIWLALRAAGGSGGGAADHNPSGRGGTGGQR